MGPLEAALSHGRVLALEIHEVSTIRVSGWINRLIGFGLTHLLTQMVLTALPLAFLRSQTYNASN